MRQGNRRCGVGHMLMGGVLLALVTAVGPTEADAARAPKQQVAYEEVVANLQVGDPRVRIDALRLLRDAGYLEAAVPVAALLGDPVGEVQVQAIETLVSIFLADETFTRKYAGDIVKQKGATLPLLAFAQGPGALVPNPVPREVVTGLIGAISSPAIDVRFNAMYALGVFLPAVRRQGPMPDASVATQRMVAAASAADPILRLAATHVLGRLFEPGADGKVQADLASARTEAGDQIVAGMNDPDVWVRSASIRAVGAMRYERAVQALTDQLGYYKKGELARELLDALARVAHPSSLGVFSALLDNGDEQIRRLAVEGIGRTGDERAFSNLEIRTARDTSNFVKQALAYLRAKQGQSAALTPLMEGFRNARLAPVAWEYLIDLGPTIAPELAPFATHKDWRVRAAVADALGVIGHAPSLAVVEGLSRDKNDNVVAAARRSLNRLTPRPAGAPRPT